MPDGTGYCAGQRRWILLGSHHQAEIGRRILIEALIDHRAGIPVQPANIFITHHSHDLPYVRIVGVSEVELLAERVLMGKYGIRQSLIDYDDMRRFLGVLSIQEAARPQWNSHHRKIIRSDRTSVRFILLATAALGVTNQIKPRSVARPGQRNDGHCRGFFHSGQAIGSL